MYLSVITSDPSVTKLCALWIVPRAENWRLCPCNVSRGVQPRHLEILTLPKPQDLLQFGMLDGTIAKCWRSWEPQSCCGNASDLIDEQTEGFYFSLFLPLTPTLTLTQQNPQSSIRATKVKHWKNQIVKWGRKWNTHGNNENTSTSCVNIVLLAFDYTDVCADLTPSKRTRAVTKSRNIKLCFNLIDWDLWLPLNARQK